MHQKTKIIAFKNVPSVVQKQKRKGSKIVQCHGTFDLIHPGHIIHFEEAKKLGDILIVTVTSEKFVNKGPGRPFFNDELRQKSLAALESVDFVTTVPYPAAVEAIKAVRPDVYCKGIEYKNAHNDLTGNMIDDVKTVKSVGGVINYSGSEVYSSTKLLQSNFSTQSPKVKSYCQKIAQNYNIEDIRSQIDSFSGLKVLVVGDTIFDEYETVQIQGLTSKNRILSGRWVSANKQAGGALAVFRHALKFTHNIKFVSVVGSESWVESKLSKYLPKTSDEVIRCEQFTTIRKLRYVEPFNEGSEIKKLFSVNFINTERISKSAENRLLDTLSRITKNFDLVLVMDFGHGLMTPDIRELIQQETKFLSINCQTNSFNHGFNIIDRQYYRADSFSLDEAELKLSCGIQKPNFAYELRSLQDKLTSKYAWLTRGAIESLGSYADGQLNTCPSFENTIVDSVGAGDAFCTLCSLSAVTKAPIDLGTFIAQMAGAQAVKIIGNSDPVSKGNLLKACSSMIKF